MDVPDFLLKAGGLAGSLGMTYLLFAKRRMESHASDVSTAGSVLDNYNKLADRLTLYETRMDTMRSQLNQQSDTIDKQEDQIEELNKAAVRHDNALAQANTDTADYKGKYDTAVIEIKGCRALAEQASNDLQDAFRRIVILETELRRLGGMSEENGKHIDQIIKDAKTLTDTPPEPKPPSAE